MSTFFLDRLRQRSRIFERLQDHRFNVLLVLLVFAGLRVALAASVAGLLFFRADFFDALLPPAGAVTRVRVRREAVLFVLVALMRTPDPSWGRRSACRLVLSRATSRRVS